jgi:hypothetical protein
VYDSQQTKGEGVDDGHFVGELINYVILQTPAKNITTGENAKFTLQMNIKGNTVFWGKPQDAIANNLFKNNRQSKSPMPGILADKVQDNHAKPTLIKSVWEGAKRMLSKAWENRDTLMSVA